MSPWDKAVRIWNYLGIILQLNEEFQILTFETSEGYLNEDIQKRLNYSEFEYQLILLKLDLYFPGFTSRLL